VIPTRNRWDLLRTTVRSALAQEHVELEVIVIDDGSTDETPDRLAQIADPRLRTFRHETSKGVAPARNHGIAEARGEWVATLDDDDLWAPHKLRSQIDAARERGAGFAYAGAVYFDESARVIGVARPPDPDRLPEALLKSSSIPAGSSNVVTRRDLLQAVGGFDEELFHLADWDLWLRLADRARSAAVHHTLVAYRKHAFNMLSGRDRDPLDELAFVAAKHGKDMRRATAQVVRWMAVNDLHAGRRGAAVAVYLRGAARYRSPRSLLRALRAALTPGAVDATRRPYGLDTLTAEDWTPG
jgi:glycosyltransferase involved in cell wall biosynthesis